MASTSDEVRVTATIRSGVTPAVATWFLIGTNFGVFLALPILFGSRFPYHRESLGALWGPLVFSGQWWRVISCSFVHFDFLHVLPNMVGLWILGPPVERAFGKLKFLWLYWLCGVVVALTVLTLHPFSVFVGASGPIAGLAGAVIVIYAPRLGSLTWSKRAKLGILLLYVIGLVATELTRGGLYIAHTTGLIAGMGFSGLSICAAKTRRQFLCSVGVTALMVVVAALLIRRYHGWSP